MIKVIELGASWCPGCKAQKKLFEGSGLDVEYLDIEEIDYDKHPELNTRSLPTIIVTNNGKEVKRWTSTTPIEKIKDVIRGITEETTEGTAE